MSMGKDDVLLEVVKNLPAPQRIELIEKALWAAAAKGNDLKTSEFFGELMAALKDAEIAPCLRTDIKGNSSIPDTGGAKFKEACDRVGEKCACLTKEIYNRLEKNRMGINEPLPKAKKTILGFIAWRWRETANEVEADNIFQFLLSAYGKLYLDGDKKIFEAVIRETTSLGFSSERLERCFLAMIPEGGKCFKIRYPDVARILALAWARNNELDKVAAAVRSTRPGEDYS